MLLKPDLAQKLDLLSKQADEVSWLRREARAAKEARQITEAKRLEAMATALETEVKTGLKEIHQSL